ncbi:peptidylprolyl isomerase [Agrococcus casei]|uniref:peptidylprolyl isomerase n=1 Tax=Agrococcus casei LMG 22410 TaxID=1255656 RepID=A0A1R4FPL1_9MICO|nr:peptidylprolyl isomerase [Agrococcus casei]SJM57950.1 Probable peptidyl-prolyl cis-trans isomerase B [Agrococcus casei LMG 22410]
MASSKEQRRRVRDYQARQTVHEHKRSRRRRDNIIAVIAVVVAGGLGTAATLAYNSQHDADVDASESQTTQPTETGSTEPTATDGTRTDAVPDPSYAEDRTWTGTMVVNGVELAVELDGAAAPQAVSAVVKSAQDGYYDGKVCHRMTTSPGFELLQCGSKGGDGMGEPAFQYGPIENAPEDDAYAAGTIAMARQSGNANSNGYQFFIVYGDTSIPSDAAGGYTVIGQVTGGLDQLKDDVVSLGVEGDAPDGTPVEPVSIESFIVE